LMYLPHSGTLHSKEKVEMDLCQLLDVKEQDCCRNGIP